MRNRAHRVTSPAIGADPDIRSLSESVDPASLRVAVDVGGTFTDVCVLHDATSEIRVAKVPSTPDPMDGAMAGVAAAGVDLRDVVLFSHGTTVATNALITRRFPLVAMVTTRGFRDVIEIRRGTREDLWDAYADVAAPYVRRRDRFEVRERVAYDGEVLEALDEAEARQVAALLRRRAVETVAVCFINAYANGENERRMAQILGEELPGVAVTTSSETLPEMFEHERFSTTVANAVVKPLVAGYVRRLSERLRDGGYRGDLLLLHSGGGVMTPRTVERYAVRLAASGVAAGAIASRHLASLAGYANAIGLDMGGTSTDISLASDGRLRVTREWHVEYGYPIAFPSIEVLTIGAGGGSLAWLDPGGSLRNGPQSAGAQPGPACYGKGGTQPTNTDANLVLGRLAPELVGGAVRLDAALAERAVAEQIAAPFGMSTMEAARAILAVANANMADAVRLISIRRGYDPRDFVLLVFGGAGPLHGVALARELSIPTVVVPPNPGITSALGCLLVDVRHDLQTMFLRRADDADPAVIAAEFARLEAEARERLSHEGVSEDRIILERAIAMRYLGQWRSLSVPTETGADAVAAALARFHREHERAFAYRRDDTPVEIYQLELEAIGVTPKPSLARHATTRRAMPQPAAVRDVAFDDAASVVRTPVYDRTRLAPGTRFHGPAIVAQFDSTTLVPPGVTAAVDEWSNIVLDVTGAV